MILLTNKLEKYQLPTSDNHAFNVKQLVHPQPHPSGTVADHPLQEISRNFNAIKPPTPSVPKKTEAINKTRDPSSTHLVSPMLVSLPASPFQLTLRSRSPSLR